MIGKYRDNRNPNFEYLTLAPVKGIQFAYFFSLFGVFILNLSPLSCMASGLDSIPKFRAELIVQPNLQRDYLFDNGLDKEGTRLFFRRIRPRFFYQPSERWTFFLQLGLSPGDRDLGLDSYDDQLFFPRMLFDLMASYKISESAEITIGQTKLPFSRQRPTPFANVFMFDRSIVNSHYGHDFDLGLFGRIDLNSIDLPIVLSGALTSGNGRNIRFASLQPALTMRADIFPLTNFSADDYRTEADWMRLRDWRLRLGVGYHYNPNLKREGGQTGDLLFEDGIDRQLNAFALDVMAKYSGFTLMFDFISRYSNDLLSFDPNPGSSAVKYIREGKGAMGQVNYAIDEYWAGGIEFAVSRATADLRNGTLSNDVLVPTIREFSLIGYYKFEEPEIQFQGGFTLIRKDYEHSLPTEERLQLVLQATIIIN